jgi:hypothetical protein
MTRRPGLSLVEVLSALFIMGIGLISLFTLMPYGAIQYSLAFKDDRTAQCANAAEAYMRTYWKEHILPGGGRANVEPFFQAFANPNSDPQETAPGPLNNQVPNPHHKPPVPSPANTPQPVPGVSSSSTDPSYPVFVDPMGWVARSATTAGSGRYWVEEGGQTDARIPRRNLFEVEQFALPRPPQPQNAAGIATSTLLALRLTSLLDGLTYSPDSRGADATGVAAEGSGGVVQRELRYNWLWVLQRPNNSDRSLARMTVVVFDKRSHQHAPTTAERGYTPSAAAVGQTTITFPLNGEPPGLKKGMWLLDSTITYDFYPDVLPSGQPFRNYYSKIRNANFYRVLSVTTNLNQVDVELHRPLPPDSKTRVHPGGPLGGTLIPDATPAERRSVLLAGVADVYEKNPLSNPQARP